MAVKKRRGGLHMTDSRAVALCPLDQGEERLVTDPATNATPYHLSMTGGVETAGSGGVLFLAGAGFQVLRVSGDEGFVVRSGPASPAWILLIERPLERVVVHIPPNAV
jgi:hypothetical protein